MDTHLVAPCGFPCAVCAQYQKKKNPCTGCLLRRTRKSEICILRNCRRDGKVNPSSCAGCRDFPCKRLRDFDSRYRKRTAEFLSVIENLRQIQEEGMERFLQQEQIKWTCQQCGALLCVNSPFCPVCGFAYRSPGDHELQKKK